MSRQTLCKTIAILALFAWGCDDSGGHGALDVVDGQNDGTISGNLTPPAECGAAFPAFGCEGNPIGEWELVGLCFETYSDCPGASVSITGSIQGSLNIGNGTFGHNYELDTERSTSVPQSCLGGRSCDSIDCFGTDHCSCRNGSGDSGSVSGGWEMDAPGHVVFKNGSDLGDFCAGADFGDSNSGGIRRIWRRVSTPCTDACDDGLACTQDYCASDIGGCASFPVPTGGPEGWLTDPECQNGIDDDCDGLFDTDDPDCLTEPCTTAADCTDDHNPCTVTTCDGEGFCRTADAPDGTTCPGADACTATFLCRRDQCAPGPATLDADADGFIDAACQFGSDCDDSAKAIHFGAEGPRGAASCSDGIDNDCDGVVDVYDADCWEANCSAEGWCLEHPRPFADDLNGLWAPAPDDVWAVGDFGQTLHWDATGWSRADVPSYFALESVCGCAANDGWAVGSTGDVFHYDGNQWAVVDTGNGGPTAYFGVDCLCDGANATQEVWAVGRSGEVSVYDGTSWTHSDHPTAVRDLVAVWVPAAGEAWVAGQEGFISHFSNGAWQDSPSGQTLTLNGLWGAAADRLWTVGVSTFLAFDGGSTWSPVVNLGATALYDVWGLGNQLWIAGDGVLYDYDTVLQSGNHHDLGIDPPTLRAVRSFGPQDTWAVGESGAIVHVVDQETPTHNSLTTSELWSVCGTNGANQTQRIWAVGSSEDAFFLRDEGGWQAVPASMNDWMRDVYCAGSYGVFAVGGESWMRWGDGILEGGVVPDLQSGSDLLAVDGRVGPDGVELIAVGDNTLIAYYDGQEWTSEVLSSSAYGEFNDVWMSPDPQSPLQAVAVGYSGRCYTYDGATWTTCALESNDNLNGVWGDGQGGIWLVGAYGQLSAWNGTAFAPLDIGQASEYLFDVQGTGPNDVWVLGEEHVWHFNGANWTSEPMELAHPSALYVTATEVWAVGRNGAILRRAR